MHDLSDNVYLKNRICSLADYSLHKFLHNEIAVERKADINSLVLAVYDLMIIHGFDFHLAGFKFLASITARYLVKSDYIESAAVSATAVANGTDEDFVISSIRCCIDENKNFHTVLAKTLGRDIVGAEVRSMTDVITILGALFKIYYNYSVDTEDFKQDAKPAINFNRIVLNNGQTRKKV